MSKKKKTKKKTSRVSSSKKKKTTARAGKKTGKRRGKKKRTSTARRDRNRTRRQTKAAARRAAAAAPLGKKYGKPIMGPVISPRLLLKRQTEAAEAEAIGPMYGPKIAPATLRRRQLEGMTGPMVGPVISTARLQSRFGSLTPLGEVGSSNAAIKSKRWPGKRRGKKKVAASSAPATTAPRAGKKRSKVAPAAASAEPRAGKKRTGKKKRAAKKRRPVGNIGLSRKASTEKFKLMHKWGFPSRRPLTLEKKGKLREAASGRVTYNQIMSTIASEKQKAWVCVGPRRTGCGGGAKNLKGGHQIGIFGSLHAK